MTPIDPGTGDVGSPVRLGNRPTSIAAGSDVLWAANHGDGTLSSIDPTTGAVTATLEIGAPVATLAVDGSRIWVTIATTTPG